MRVTEKMRGARIGAKRILQIVRKLCENYFATVDIRKLMRVCKNRRSTELKRAKCGLGS